MNRRSLLTLPILLVGCGLRDGGGRSSPISSPLPPPTKVLLDGLVTSDGGLNEDSPIEGLIVAVEPVDSPTPYPHTRTGKDGRFNLLVDPGALCITVGTLMSTCMEVTEDTQVTFRLTLS